MIIQSFGEVTQIVRVPNGDLHVHFRKAEVADTVSAIFKILIFNDTFTDVNLRRFVEYAPKSISPALEAYTCPGSRVRNDESPWTAPSVRILS